MPARSRHCFLGLVKLKTILLYLHPKVLQISICMAKWLHTLLIITLLSKATVFGNTGYVDSLRIASENSRNDSLRIDALSNLAIAYSDSAYVKSIAYWRKALKLASKNRFREQMAHIHHQIGYVLFNQGEFKESLLEYQNALSVHTYMNNPKGIGQLHNDIGLVYKTWGRYEQALENFLNGLRVFDEINDDQGIGMVSNNIGQIYFYREDYDNAIKYFIRYLEVNQKENRVRAVAGASNNIAAAYMELKNYPSALKYYNSALSIYDSLGIQIGVAILNDNIGMLYAKTNDFEQALKNHFVALNIFKNLNSYTRLAHTKKNIGFSYYKTGNLTLSVEYLLKAMELAKQFQQRELEKEIYFNLSIAYEASQQPTKALQYFKLMTQLKDSLINAQTAENLSSLELRYDTEKKDRELRYFQDRFQNQRYFKHIFGGVILLFLVIILLLVKDNQKRTHTIQKVKQRKAFLINTLEHTIKNFKLPQWDNNVGLQIICNQENDESKAKSDSIMFQKNNLRIVIAFQMLSNTVNSKIVKAFLYNELSEQLLTQVEYKDQSIIKIIDSKVLYIKQLFDIQKNDILHACLLFDYQKKTASFWGENGTIWLVEGDSVCRVVNNSIFELKEKGVGLPLLLIISHPPGINISSFEEKLEKTLISSSAIPFQSKVDILRSAVEAWSITDPICNSIMLMAIEVERV
jgi:tetratricopeptide (TPR) repeat protein